VNFLGTKLSSVKLREFSATRPSSGRFEAFLQYSDTFLAPFQALLSFPDFGLCIKAIVKAIVGKDPRQSYDIHWLET